MSYNVEWLSRGTIIHFQGKVNIDEFNLAKSSLYEDPRFQNHNYSICDFSYAELNEIELNEVAVPAANDKGASSYLPKYLVAFVVKDDYGLEVMNEYVKVSKKLQSPWTFGVFKDLFEAKKWVID